MKLRRISGNSMSPSVQEGDICLFIHGSASVGSIVLAKHNNREIVKRVTRIEDKKYFLQGDNPQHSTDSRHYGFVNRSAILGVSMIVLPVAVSPPKPLKKSAVWFGRVVGVILTVMALVHLYRIDTFIPVLDNVLPGGSLAASFVALGIIISEIFAIPFSLRMKLSPLGHLVSGGLMAFAPLWWLLMSIWNFDMPGSIGLLSSFVDVPPAPLVVVICILWIAFNYYTLYLLGYNRLTVSSVLRKQ